MNESLQQLQHSIDGLDKSIDKLIAQRNRLREACEAAHGHLANGDGNSFDLAEMDRYRAGLIEKLEAALEATE